MDGQTLEEYSEGSGWWINWRGEVKSWSEDTVMEYLAWAKETFGEDEVTNIFRRADQWRAVKEIEASVDVQPKVDTFTSHLAHAMLHTKEVMAANLIKKMWGSDDGDNTKGLWKDE